MHRQSWQDLWNLFLAVMANEPIHIRVAIGMALTFLGVMSLTGIADSFLPKRAARRYAAMYDLTATAATRPPQQSFEYAPPAPVEEPANTPELSGPDAGEPTSLAAMRRSVPPSPKVFRAQKP